jgi:hypothetical protein
MMHSAHLLRFNCPLTGPACEAEAVPPESTVGLISVVREPYGRCTNTYKIYGFAECIGKCDSRTVYNSSKLYHYFINLLLLFLLSPLLFAIFNNQNAMGVDYNKMPL